MRQSTAGLILLLALVLVACVPPPTPTPPPTATADGCSEPSVMILDEGWRFRTDPDDVGLSRRWYLSPGDDSQWQQLAPGEPWETSGVDYDGVAWYRTTVSMPGWAEVYLGFGRVDDVATLWLDGERQMSWEAGDADSEAQALDITDFGEAGDQVTLTLRIEDQGGYGGVKGRVMLSDEPRGVMDDHEYVTWLFESHADWPRPDWVRGEPLAWTMTGLPETEADALVRSDGAVAPWATSPTVETWLYDPATDQLATGTQAETTFSLHQTYLPIPTWEWDALDYTVTSVLFGDIGERSVRWQISVRNADEAKRDLILVLVVRPLGINQSLAPICSAGLQGESRLWINGEPFLIAGRSPDQAGVASLQETMAATLQGQAPGDRASFHDPSGLGAATLTYRLSLDEGQSETLQFAFPVTAGADTESGSFPSVQRDAAHRLEKTTARWNSLLDEAQFDVPDDLVEAGLKASTAYLILAVDPNGPHPGPLTHDAMWVRDAAYIGLALLQLGHPNVVHDFVSDILAAQETDGRVPPIQGDNIPWEDEEWDAQGQAIFLATTYFRYTGDVAALEEWYPAVRAAARYLVKLRDTGSADEEAAVHGLLPPSKSAEDLGPSDHHYYWDNLWALTGLEEAAYAARELGRSEDAAWMEAEADALRNAILRSVERVMGSEPAYIPGAVEDTESSAMARGTVPALWPVRVLSPQSPLVGRSFDTYYERWIAADNGGFRHRQNQFWPYGGLELAHAYLRLGRQDVLHQVLGWTLEHQTLRGTFAWAEQVDPQSWGISGGDMPHAWAAASYATLVREMLVSEREGHLELFTGVPGWWFEEHRTITLAEAPTHFGKLNLHTEGTLKATDGGWHGVLRLTLSGAEPPAGFRWHLPYKAENVNGPPGTVLEEGWLTVPKGGGTVRLTFSPGE